jgi:hypothetical protein
MGSEYSVYGFEVVNSLYEGEDWTYSPRFPRVTLCDFEIRQMTNLQRWTVQCVLPVNLFNEKTIFNVTVVVCIISSVFAYPVSEFSPYTGLL